MRIACLQFAPQVGDVNNNLNRADAVLSRANPDDLDLLVLPELAFSGYNFKSLSDISPFLEPSGAGITSLWARTTALKYNCVVAAGYPEKVDVSRNWPTSPEYYNSVIVVNQEGETTGNYRKSHLYYTDETWALEGTTGFFKGYIPGVGRVAMGICMDLNPYKFEAPWTAYEFAFHALDIAANVVILSMAWLTREDARHFSRTPKEPDMETLTYWVKRLEPLIRSENDDEIIVIFANRTGSEEEAVYAGTSAVIGIRHGEVSVYGLLGRGEKELLVVDTSLPPFAKLVYRPEGEETLPDGTPAEYAISQQDHEYGISTTRSTASSGVSTASSVSGSNAMQPPIMIDPAKDEPRESTRRIFGGHIFITQDAFTPLTSAFPTTPFEESPASPRYFWVPSEHTKTLDPASVRPTTSSPRAQNSSTSAVPTRSHSARAVESASEIATQYQPDEEADFSELVKSLRNETSNPSGGSTCPARPSSPKSRNASRTGRGERSDSVVARRPTSVFGNRAPSAIPAQDILVFRPESPKSRNTSRNRSQTNFHETSVGPSREHPTRSMSRSQNRRPTPLELGLRNQSRGQQHDMAKNSAVLDSNEERHHSASPDMEKLGADLLVFEEGERRPRRDSLECHADEDDFVTFHASMRRERHEGSNSNREKDTVYDRSGSQRPGTPKHVGSPALSSFRSPKESRAFGMPQASPDLPNSRAISRGRQRTAKWAQSTASPKPPSFRAPASPSPPESRDNDKSQVSRLASPLSLYKSPEVTKANVKAPKASDSRSRRDSSTQQKVATNDEIQANRPRNKSSRASLSPKPGFQPPSIQTIETVLAPTSPEYVPPTPKAMVLEPDWDKAIQAQATIVDTLPLTALDSQVNRPKSMVW